MPIPRTLKKFAPLLLLLAAVLFMIEDTDRFRPAQLNEETAASSQNGHSMAPHSHEGEGDPHDDPEKNRRMGIFHYNEANKFAKQKQWDEAIKNYKMALHHNKESQETHVNLSTAYMQAKRFEEARETLQTLKNINPETPALHYNLACLHSLTGNPKESLDALQTAIDKGYKKWKQIDSDPDLANLRQDMLFKEWRARYAPQ